VLVVEPDGLLRTLVAEWLEQAGIHAVFPAPGPCEATAMAGSIAGDNACSIGAIVIDIPNPPQADLVLQRWRRVFPGAAIIAASARFPAGAGTDDAMAGRLAVTRTLAKPYSRHELYAALGLQGRRGGRHAPME
jgi:DNA-binding response OmpR family regulator